MMHFTTDRIKLHQGMFFVNLCLISQLIFLCTGYVRCKWCTRITSEEHVMTITEASQCHQSYRDNCGLFSFSKCTFYELVTCYKERNHTVVQYKIVEECCPGYWLDPTTNVTCVQRSEEPVSWNTPSCKKHPPNCYILNYCVENDLPESQVTHTLSECNPHINHNEAKVEEVTLDSNLVPVVKLSPLVNDGNLTKTVIHRTKVPDRNYTVQYFKSDDRFLFGLSHGAYAGIICAFLFIACVLILIIVHIIKRKRKSAVAKASVGMENEMCEKMIPPPQA